MHALYDLDDWESEKDQKESRLIAEWLARQSRKDPKLLRCAIINFDLDPEIYDQISYFAFKDIAPFPISQETLNFLTGLQPVFPTLAHFLPLKQLEENLRLLRELEVVKME